MKRTTLLLLLVASLPLMACAETGQERARQEWIEAMRELEETADNMPRTWEEAERRARQSVAQAKAEDYFDSPEQIALAKAVERGDIEAMQRAIAQGADVNCIGRQGVTPLFWALIKQNFKGYRFLLEQGADPNLDVEPSNRGWQAVIEFAAAHPEFRWLKAALEHGGNPNATYTEWELPIIYEAILYRRLDNVKLLLEHGADINYQDKSGGTPLHKAVSTRIFTIALFLLTKGADPTQKDRWGDSPVDIVAQFGNRGIDRRTNDLAAYDDFVAELKRRGLLEKDPPRFE